MTFLFNKPISVPSRASQVHRGLHYTPRQADNIVPNMKIIRKRDATFCKHDSSSKTKNLKRHRHNIFSGRSPILNMEAKILTTFRKQ